MNCWKRCPASRWGSRQHSPARHRAVLLILTGCVLLAGARAKAQEVSLQLIQVRSRSEAEEVLKRLKAGQSFEALAKQFSINTSAAKGGYIGKLDLSTLHAEVRRALKGLRAGQVTDVIETASGFMILKVAPEIMTITPGSLFQGDLPFRAFPLNYDAATYVCGRGEVENYFRSLPKPPDYQQDLEVNCQSRLREVREGIQELERHFSGPANPQGRRDDPKTELLAHYVLAQLYSFQGDMEKAIQHFEAARDLAASLGLEEYQLNLEKILGIAQMRRGENENCVLHHHAEMCVLPLSPEAQHTRVSGSEKAIQHFLKYLDRKPGDYEIKWLLNVAYMTLGKYPGTVPKEHLVPLAPFESNEDIGRFVDVAPSLGLDVLNAAGGAIMDDFDNDGFLDLVISSSDPCTSLRYFHNNGDGTFTDRTAQAGLSKQLGGLNLVQTDYNNDGWLDIHVMRGAWQSPVRASLLRNNGDGTFTDVTYEAGLAIPATSTQAAAWADFDNDGNIDLFVGNENSPSQLFHNNGNGTFTDVARRAGVDRIAFTKGAAWGDYDNDGYPDLYVSNEGSENFLYHNNRNGTFTDVAKRLNVEMPIWSFPTWFFDYDNDGWLDLYVSSHIESLSEVIRSYLGLPVKTETHRLYKNTKGSFRDVTKEVGLDRVLMPMGANFGDVDNDGYLDIYLGTGAPSYAALVPNVLFRNHAGQYFADITASSRTGSLQKGHAVAIGPIFNDGQPAIFAQIGGMVPGDQYYNALFKNPGSGHSWIDIKLVGRKSNRAAIGARLKIVLPDEGGASRCIYRGVTSGGSFGASPLEQHIGLGNAKRIASVEVGWPTSGTRQVFRDLSINQFVEIREFENNYTVLKRRAVSINPDKQALSSVMH